MHNKLNRFTINVDDDLFLFSVEVSSSQDGNEGGKGTFCKFSQPTGLCSEGYTIMTLGP